MQHRAQPVSSTRRSAPSAPGRRKFLRLFPKGFQDEQYLDWERDYKWEAHRQWHAELSRSAFQSLLQQGNFTEIATRAIRIESRTNLLFSFEKMALRDAIKTSAGARAFAKGLFAFIYGPGRPEQKFETWCRVVAALPRKQTRVLTWPVVSVFGFIAQPKTHVFLKPNAMRAAARHYGMAFLYKPQPSWVSYRSFLTFARSVRRDLRDMQPRDMIDIQSFLWVLGSDEYKE
jgi:hypothetical protein